MRKAGLPAVFLSVAAVVAAAPYAAAGTGEKGKGGAPVVRLSTAFPRQGDPVVVRFSPGSPADNVSIAWKGRVVPMKEEAPGRYVGLIGVDIVDPPGKVSLVLAAERMGKRSEHKASMKIASRGFPVQRLSLPPAKAEFDNAALARIEKEKKALEAKMSAVSLPLLWELPFCTPVEDYRPKGFGARRIINGEPRSPHAGVDVSAPEGTPVRAVAAGTVVLAGEQFFGGKSVVIDHGGGMFSLYYHLRAFGTAEGQSVRRGEKIGEVGFTGRAVGPHLHFGIRAAGGRVDPGSLFGHPR